MASKVFFVKSLAQPYNLKMQLMFPGQMKQWSRFYLQLAQLLKSGFTLSDSVQRIASTHPSAEIKNIARILYRSLKAGKSVEFALKPLNQKIPAIDEAILIAGERAGKLEQFFKILSEYYNKESIARSKMFAQLGYPFFLILMMLLSYPFSDIELVIKGQVLQFLLHKIVTIGGFLGMSWGLLWWIQPNQSQANRELLESLVRRLPIFGSLKKMTGLSRFCLSLEALTSAGMTPAESWPLSAKASGFFELEKAVRQMSVQMKAGKSPGELILNYPVFPTEFSHLFGTAELSGQIEESLRELAQDYLQSAEERMQTLVTWLPRLIFILIALLIGYNSLKSMDEQLKIYKDLGL